MGGWGYIGKVLWGIIQPQFWPHLFAPWPARMSEHIPVPTTEPKPLQQRAPLTCLTQIRPLLGKLFPVNICHSDKQSNTLVHHLKSYLTV